MERQVSAMRRDSLRRVAIDAAACDTACGENDAIAAACAADVADQGTRVVSSAATVSVEPTANATLTPASACSLVKERKCRTAGCPASAGVPSGQSAKASYA